MKPQRIELTIDELLLRDLPYADREQIAAALEQELERLLREQGLPEALTAGETIPEMCIDDMGLANSAEPKAIGVQIAEQVYANLINNQTHA